MDFYVVSTLYNIEKSKYAEFLCHPHQTVSYHASFKEAIEKFHNTIINRIQK